MRAVRSTGRGVEVVDVPEAEGPGEPISLRAASICGSDFGYIAAGSRHILGHELAGVRGDGTAVAVEGIWACHACQRCATGQYNLCEAGMARALGLGSDGGMRERFLAPPEHLLALPPELPVEDASIVEPLAVSLHGIRLARLQAGQRVAVVGGGAIGLLAVAGLQGRGVEVGLRARHRHQIAMGERLGARPADGEYDIVIEAAGSRSGLTEALQLCAPGATLIILGVYDDGIPLPMGAFTREIAVKSSLGYCRHEHGRDFDDAIALLAARPELARAMITHRFPLADAVEAFRVAADRSCGAIRVALHA